MGDRPPIPYKAADFTVVSASLAGFFEKIPWPGIAAFLAAVYTLMRIVQLIREWRRK